MSQLITKDFYKADVYRFDMECSSQEVPNDILFNKDGTIVDAPCTIQRPMVTLNISNVISWELMSVKMTKDELKGLGDFIKTFLGE